MRAVDVDLVAGDVGQQRVEEVEGGERRASIIYIYIYIYICMYIYMYAYIYIYREREREIEIDR